MPTCSRRCRPGAALVVTADHGQVDVGANVEVLGPEIMDDVTLISGEGRFRWLHARPGAVDDVAATAAEQYADLAWVRTKEQMIAEGWLGGVPTSDGGRPAWATWSWSRSHRRRSSTRPTPASCGSRPGTGPSPPAEMLVPLLAMARAVRPRRSVAQSEER